MKELDATHFDVEDMRRYLSARDQSEKEGTRARAWRESMGLSRRELAELTGYGERTIAAFEAGEFGPGKPIDERTMRTYRLACASLAFGIDFNWSDASLSLGNSRITVPSIKNVQSSKETEMDRAIDLALALRESAGKLNNENISRIIDALLLEFGMVLSKIRTNRY